MSKFSVFLILSLTLQTTFATKEKQKKTFEAVWQIAHNPGNRPVVELVQSFADRIYKQSNKRLKITVNAKNPKDQNSHVAALRDLLSNKSQISQVGTSMMARYNNDLYVLDQPFIFRGYDHCTEIFDSEIGQKLVADIYKGSGKKLRGFALAFSGGKRVFFSKEPLKTFSDFKKLKIWHHGTPYRREFLEKLGINFHGEHGISQNMYPEKFISGVINADYGELNRLAIFRRDYPSAKPYTNYVNETHHNIFATVVVTNEKFFQSLPKDLQELLSKEIKILTKAERRLSIELEVKNREALKKEGVKFVKFSEKDRHLMLKTAANFRQKHEKKLGALVEKIQKYKETRTLYARIQSGKR
jgi:TRAP-type C4-dicarboxylate transport system substrate-binding protein